jgi:hypothetical protein
MRTWMMMGALALSLLACGSDRGWTAATAPSAGAPDAAAGIVAAAPTAATSTPTEVMNADPMDADQASAGAECMTADGAPYEAPRC